MAWPRSEDDLPPLAALHDLLRDVGLLRLRKGVLHHTRAAGDEVEVVRRLRSWFSPDDAFISILATDSLARLVVDGPCRPQELATRVVPLIGDRWVTAQGEPLSEIHIRNALYPLGAVLTGLDLIEITDSAWAAGPSARWLLPRATALAHVWSSFS